MSWTVMIRFIQTIEPEIMVSWISLRGNQEPVSRHIPVKYLYRIIACLKLNVEIKVYASFI